MPVFSEKNDTNELWVCTLQELANKLSAESYDTWLKPLHCVAVEETKLVLQAPNRFHADWISSHFLPDVIDVLERQTGKAYQVDWNFDEKAQQQAEEKRRTDTLSYKAPAATSNAEVVSDHLQSSHAFSTAPARTTHVSATGLSTASNGASVGHPANAGRSTVQTHAIQPHSSNASLRSRGAGPSRASTDSKTAHDSHVDCDLNPKYHFDNFVVGPSNQLGYAACKSAAERSGKRGNPLFIYGGVGLGKTHLVNAVGHRVIELNPQARVRYLSAEAFTNEFIWSLQNGQMSQFRERYRRGCDLLLMDDIQFLAGREQTQEEFFHTFNALYHADRQIVVTSDVPPQRIPEMQERLISRFQWGLVADIQAPELDTRIAILRAKAEQESINLGDEVALFLAQTIQSNVRELEGTLLRIAVKAELTQRDIDINFVRETLRSALPNPDTALTVEDIQRAACEYFNIRMSDLKSHRRHRAVAFPRMVAMYLCRQQLGASFPEIGDRFGGKDHTTVMSACRKISGLIENDQTTRSAIETIERKLAI